MNGSASIPARLLALRTMPTPALKQHWRDLFESEPPPFNRRYLESRLAYRIQELSLGGLKPGTVRRLEKLGEQLDGGDKKKRGIRLDRDRPICQRRGKSRPLGGAKPGHLMLGVSSAGRA